VVVREDTVGIMKLFGPKALWFVLLCWIVVPTASATSSDSYPLADYLIQAWQTDQGLPENSATAMVQTPDGYLWFGTFNGLVRFDGVKFTIFDRSNTPELPSPGIVNLYLDHHARLWVSTLLGTAYVKDGHWRVFHESDGWRGSYVWRFAETRSGDLYMTTWDHVLLRFREDRLEQIPPPPVANPEMGFQLFVDGADDLWAVHPQFIGRLKNDKWQEMIPAAPLVGHGISQVRPDLLAGTSRDGGFWIATRHDLRKYHGSHLVSAIPAPWPLESLWSVYEDSNGGVWISSSANGLYHFSPERGWQHLTAENGLTYHAVRFVFEDRERNLWVGTSGGGLERFKRRYVFSWGTQQGLPEPVVKSVTADAWGRIYLGTWGQGVWQLSQNKILPVLPRWDKGPWWKKNIVSPDGSNIAFDGLVLSVLLDHRGRLWIGTSNDGLFLLEGHILRGFFNSPLGGGPQVSPLFEDSGGRIWAGTEGGAFVWDGSQFKKYPLVGAPEHSSVRSIAEDVKSATIWVGNQSGGIYRLQENRFVPVPEANGVSRQSILTLLADKDGTLWMGTEDGGVACLREGRLTRISEQQGLPARGVVSIQDDGLGNLWFGSNRGILRVSRKALEELISGRKNRIDFQVFNQSDGLATTDAQPTSARDSSGRLWFASTKGVTMIDPKALRLNEQSPPVAIEQISVDDEPVAVSSEFATSAPAAPLSITIPPGDHRLEIHYSGLSFTAPEKVRFRSMLEGFDKEWIDVGDRRTAYLQHVRPGTYHFRVKAANNDGVWNETGPAATLYFKPHFYETYWFYTLCVLGVVTVVAAGHRRRLQALTARATQLEKLVKNRTFDLAKQHAFLQQVLDINPNFIFAKNREGRFTLVNRALAEFFHSVPEALIGKTEAELGIQRGEVRSFRRDDLEVMDTLKEKLIPEEPVTDPEGKLHWLQTTKRPIVGEDHKAHQVLGVASDITARKLAEEQLASYREHLEQEVASRTAELTRANAQLRQEISERQKLEEQLRQAQKMEAIGNLSGGIAHDFNNLLTIIKGYGVMLLERVQGDKELQDFARQIDGAAERAASLTNQLLAFSRRQVLQPKQVNLNSVLVNLNRMLQRLVGEDIEMVVAPAPNLESIKADPGQLEQVIMNLVVNARDAMPAGGKLTLETANVELDETYTRDHVGVRPGPHVMLAVSDTGMGMDSETMSHIFEPFYTTKERGRGTGLGLSMVYGIVEQSQGHIWVYSEPELGTTFKIYFPKIAEAVPAAPVLEMPSVHSGTGTILLAEDDRQLQELASSVLTGAGYKVLAAEDARTALSICETHPGRIDLLLTDVVMPGLSGPQLANHVLTKRPNLKVLYMSGYTFVQHGVLAPGTFFLQKPFTPSSLIGKVVEVLNSQPHNATSAERKSTA